MKVYFTAAEYIDSLEERLERKDTTIKMLVTLIEGIVERYKIPLDKDLFTSIFLSDLREQPL